MENNFVKYKDLLTIKEFDKNTDNEEFVYLPLEDEFVIGRYQENKNMLEYGEKIVVRKTVYEKLKEASKILKKYNKNYKLIVVFGLRDMKVQEKFFYEIYDEVKENFTDKLEMYEYIHEKIAVPEVAGHPTGGAVDIAIYDNKENKIIDFGSNILDWDTKKCYFNCNEISETAIENRKLLRNIMTKVGFAPYDGEWWHFSYGDKEWAFYYKKEKALYNQVNADDIFKKVKYIKFIPGGNDTALVLSKNYSKDEKKEINDEIMNEDKTIEQVGFVDKSDEPELQMAGGEFCGNATRSSALYYLDGKCGNIKIKVNGKDIIETGVYQNGEAWCQIPLYIGENQIVEIEEGIYKVRMNGMISIVIKENISKKYLENKDELKETALSFINKYKLKDSEAVGVMFLEQDEKLKINPVVWVRDIDTLFYETACGSGTTATAMVKAFLENKNQEVEVVQPSGLIIKANIEIEDSCVKKAIISGKVLSDFDEKEIVVLGKKNY